jgi:hypothetical protein
MHSCDWTPRLLTAEEAFSGIFGIFEEHKVWKIPGTLFEVFQGKDGFYHRDQLVPVTSPVPGLSINYHGELRLTSDRLEIVSQGQEFKDYNTNLTETLDKGVSTNHELAVLIMKSTVQGNLDSKVLRPKTKQYAAEYRAAFEAACEKEAGGVYPFAWRAKEEALIREFGFSHGILATCRCRFSSKLEHIFPSLSTRRTVF